MINRVVTIRRFFMKRLIAIFLVGLVFLSFGSQARWDKLWDKEVGIVVVDQNLMDGTTRLFATEKTTGDLYIYGDTLNSWTKVSESAKYFVSTGEGLYKLSSDGTKTYRYIGPNNWEIIPGGDALKIFGGGNKLYATKPPRGEIYEFSGRGFTKIGGAGKMFVAGGCQDCWNDMYGFLYRIATDGNSVWRYPKGVGDWTWNKIGGPAALIYAGSDSLYATDPVHGDIYRYVTGDAWEAIGGPGKMWAIDIIGKGPGYGSKETLYGLSGDGKQIWRWEGQPEEWTQIDTTGLNIPLNKIYAGGGQLYAVAKANRLWKHVP